MREQNYTNKILYLFIVTLTGIFVIWYALIRQESVDWLSSQIVHQVSPYAVSEIDNSLIINNIALGYEFKLPPGFKTSGSKNLVLFREEDGERICDIKHYYLKSDKVLPEPTKIVLAAQQGKLVFELEDKTKINDCNKYLEEIKNNLIID